MISLTLPPLRSPLATLIFGLSAMACEPPVPPPIKEPDTTRSQQEPSSASASEALDGTTELQGEREDLGSAPEESLRLKLDPSLFPQGGPGVAAPRLNPPSEELKLRPPAP